jgi:hypothetical protein
LLIAIRLSFYKYKIFEVTQSRNVMFITRNMWLQYVYMVALKKLGFF